VSASRPRFSCTFHAISNDIRYSSITIGGDRNLVRLDACPVQLEKAAGSLQSAARMQCPSTVLVRLTSLVLARAHACPCTSQKSRRKGYVHCILIFSSIHPRIVVQSRAAAHPTHAVPSSCNIIIQSAALLDATAIQFPVIIRRMTQVVTSAMNLAPLGPNRRCS